MAYMNKPQDLTTNIWASAGEVVEPDAAKRNKGWIAEIPPFQFENWIQNRQERAIAHIIQMGIAEWDANTQYQANKSYVQDEDGEIYRCLVTHETVNPKYDDQSFWEKPFTFDVLKEQASENNSGVVYKADQKKVDEGTPGAFFLDPAQIKDLLRNLNASWIVGGVLSSGTLPSATEGSKGAVRKARQKDIDNGVGDDRYVSAAQLYSTVQDIQQSRVGVALTGEQQVTAGSSETYQITNMSSFSIYEASLDFTDDASGGTVGMTDNLVNLDVDAGSSGSVILTITKDGVKFDFSIAIGSSQIDRPNIKSPSDGASDVSTQITLKASNFKTTPSGFDTHTATDWEVASDSSFATIVAESSMDSTNLVEWTVDADLEPNKTYYARVRYYGDTITRSAWSLPISFETAERPDTPSISEPQDGQTNVEETPEIVASSFNSPVAETHQATDWEVRKVSDDSLVWSSENNTSDLTSISVPSGVLAETTEYRINVRYIGSQLGASAWGTSTFTTEDQFFAFTPEYAGRAFGGGYYAGANIVVGSKTYAVVVAPKSQGGEASSTQWKTSPSTTSGTDSTNDGRSNTAAMISDSASSHPAAQFCDNLTINGHSDWHLPSVDELEICYRYLKPTTKDTRVGSSSPHNTSTQSNPNSVPVLPSGDYTSNYPAQTSIAAFQEGGLEAFPGSYYWSSTQYSSSLAGLPRFDYGTQGGNNKINSFYVRAVRWVEV